MSDQILAAMRKRIRSLAAENEYLGRAIAILVLKYADGSAVITDAEQTGNDYRVQSVYDTTGHTLTINAEKHPADSAPSTTAKLPRDTEHAAFMTEDEENTAPYGRNADSTTTTPGDMNPDREGDRQ